VLPAGVDVTVTASMQLQASGKALFAGDVAARMKRGVLYLASEWLTVLQLAGPVGGQSDVRTFVDKFDGICVICWGLLASRPLQRCNFNAWF
jgi:hypothetical protein